MMEEYLKNGQLLFQSVENLRNSARDLVALNDSIHTYLKNMNFNNYDFDLEKSKDDDEKNEWCRMAQSFDVDVKETVGDKRKKQRFVGTITVITRLCDFEINDYAAPKHPWNKQACIIAGWHKATEWQVDDGEGNYWAIDQFDPDNMSNIHHCESGLWAWKGEEDETEYAYFFALPIFSVVNENQIDSRILKPLVTLFESENPAETAQTALDGVPVLLPSSG